MSLKRGKGHKARPGNRAMTRQEQRHVDTVKSGGCGCCIARGYQPDEGPPAVEAHHHKRGNLRIGHMATEGLCSWHHRGVSFITDEYGKVETRAHHRLLLGPNLHDDHATFVKIFGSDEERLWLQAERLGLPAPVAA